MKKIILGIAILWIATWNIRGQSLLPLRTEIKDKYTLKAGEPVKIVETIIDYKNNGVESKKRVIDFSNDGNTITTNEYEDGIQVMSQISVYNNFNCKISDNFKRRIKDKNSISSSTFYTYNGKGLSEVKETHEMIRNQDGNYKRVTITTSAILECDSLGNPIDSKLYDSKKLLLIHETGEYHYNENNWIYSVFKPNGQLIRKEESEINRRKKCNENGDEILYSKNHSKNNKTFFRVDYKYDATGNWIEKKVYQFKKEGEKISGESIYQTVSRTIEYKKQLP